MSKIILNNLEFFASHGFYEEEQAAGNLFRLDVEIGCDLAQSGKSGSIDDTINYEDVYLHCAEEMAERRQLLEELLESIGNRLLNHFDKIETLSVRLSKHAPQLGGKVESVILEREWKKLE